MNRHFIYNSLAILVGVFMSLSVANGQDINPGNKVHIGFEAGLNVSGFTNDVGPVDKNSPGYQNGLFVGSFQSGLYTLHAGITADMRLSNTLSIATELMYNGHGADYEIENDDVVLVDTAGNQTTAYDHYIYDLGYLEMPVMLRYTLPVNDDKMSYMVYGGVSAGINVYSNIIYNYYSVDDDGNANTNSKNMAVENVRKTVVNPIAGLWIQEKENGSGWGLFGDIRLEYSTTPVFTVQSKAETNYETGMWNINFGFGIRF